MLQENVENTHEKTNHVDVWYVILLKSWPIPEWINEWMEMYLFIQLGVGTTNTRFWIRVIVFWETLEVHIQIFSLLCGLSLCLICIQYVGISIKNCHELHPEPVYSFAGTPYTQQSYKVSESFPYKWINKKWKEGFHVTSMTTAGSRWGVVMSRNSGYSEQVL